MPKKKARTDFQRTVDDYLTEKINNNRDAREFILKNTGRMAKEIEDRFGSDLVQVYIKGKSSLKLMKLNDYKKSSKEEKEEEIGWSDFDNQIIINPYLPRVWWYEILNQIHCYLRDEYLPSVSKELLIKSKDDTDVTSYKAPHLGEIQLDNKICSKFDVSGPETKLKHMQKMQSNVMFCLGNEYLHPQNFFDNARSIFLKDTKTDLNLMSEDFSEANDFFPPSIIVFKDNNGKKIKTDSSIWINTSISKFFLYRVIVRYGAPGINVNGDKVRDDINSETSKFRGEVIDISIPRREDEETINYWSRFKNDIKPLTDNNTYIRDLVKKDKDVLTYLHAIRIPGWEYQLQENVMLLNEVLTHSSGSAHKFYKRLERAWPALEAIEVRSESDSENTLNKNIAFDGIKELLVPYGFYKDKGAIRSFYKQFSIILKDDYHWSMLDEKDKVELVLNFLPTFDSKKINHKKIINDKLNSFNLKKESKENDTLALTVLKDAFSIKDKEKFDNEALRKEAVRVSGLNISNYEELLKHLMIIKESNRAFGKKYNLNFKNINHINEIRLRLEEFCKKGKKESLIEIIKSDNSIDENENKPIKKYNYSRRMSVLNINVDEDFYNNKLTVSDVNNKDVDTESMCYFCGIISSNLDLSFRIKAFDIEYTNVDYYFPVVNLYLKCSKEQWNRVIKNYKSEINSSSPNEIILKHSNGLEHKIRINFVDKKEIDFIKNNDSLLAKFESDLVEKRVNDRVSINNLNDKLDELYRIILDMKSILVLPFEENDAVLKKDFCMGDYDVDYAERYKNNVNETLIPSLKNIYNELVSYKELLIKSENKGDIDDLIKDYKNIVKLSKNIHGYVNNEIYKSGASEDLNMYCKCGINYDSIKNLVFVSNEIYQQTKELNNSKRINNVESSKKLISYANGFEKNQKNIIFSEIGNSRNLMIEGNEFRILREKQINEYYHYSIGKTRDFYLLHWLDKNRIYYKSNITNFRINLTKNINLKNKTTDID